MTPEMQALAARRFGGNTVNRANTSAAEPETTGNWGTVGMQGTVTGRTNVNQPSPQPGIAGVTPGAIERRQGGAPPSMQAPPPPASFNDPQMINNAPNMSGPARADLTAPVGNLQAFLQNLQNKNSQGRIQ